MIRWLVLALALTSCVDQPTQVFVRLATDIPDIDTVVIRIYDDDEALVREQVLPPDRLSAVPADGRFHPIGTFGLVPQDNDPNRRFRVVIDVTVRREETVRFETRARSGFVRDNTIRLDIFIAELCIDLAEMCEEEGLTCGIDGCVPEDVPPESLPPIDDDPIPDDPIDPRRFDGGFVADSGVDAPTEDVPGDAPDLDAMDSATDTLRFDGGPDGGIDAPFDAGLDAPVLDATGGLTPGVDNAPIVFPWAGYRDEDGVPRIAFREIPGAVQYIVTLRDIPPSGTFREEFVAAMGPGIRVVPLPGIPFLPRRAEVQVRSCDGLTVFDCNGPTSRPRYIDLERVRCDLNDDGQTDIIAIQSNGTLNVWVNGPGSAPSTLDAHTGTSATVSACADLDGDGNAEIVSIQAANGDVAITDWAGAALTALASPFRATATTMIAGDFDADGFEDIVFADVNNGRVQYARGAAGQTLMSPIAIAREAGLAFAAAGRYGRDLAVSDIDADGFLDLIIADADDRDAMTKNDTGLQICYGGIPAFADCGVFPVPDTARGEHFGFQVAGLGISDEGRGGFVVGAPEAGIANTGRVYEFRDGAGDHFPVDSPAAAAGFCCFPNDLSPGPRDFGTATHSYYVGYGDFETMHFGRTYRCSGGSCTTIAAPGNVADSYFGFDVMSDLDGDRLVALSRAGGQNGVYVYTGSWQRMMAPPPVNDLTRLAD